MDLAFGIKNLETPNFTRKRNSFLGFVSFNEKDDFENDLYFAENPKFIKSVSDWYTSHPEKNTNDFPRRLFLYKTFLQAKRIEKVLENYSEQDTILVVIGAYHKNDIEKYLNDKGFTIIQPSSFGLVTKEEIDDNFTDNDAFAILSYNLLGMQFIENKMNVILIEKTLNHLKNNNSLEKIFFETKYNLYNKKIISEQAIEKYNSILNNLNQEKFTWTGVKDSNRVDSYFDPFGNLSFKERIHLEKAREYKKINNIKEFNKELKNVFEDLNEYKKAMLNEYIEEYLN